MNKLLAVLALCWLLAPVPAIPAPLPFSTWLYRRFHPEELKVRPVEGLTERVTDGKLHLTLKDFLELVLHNSTEVNLTRLDVYTAADQVQAAKAPLDPVLQTGFSALRGVSPEFTQISGAETLSGLTQTTFLNYQQLLPTGQTISAQFNAVRSSSNSAFNFFNPSIFGTLNLQVTQPLLQGRTGIQFRAPLEIARTQLMITSEVSEASIADTVTMAALQYWEAVRARDVIAVQQQTLDLAQKSYDRDKQALDLGALAKLSIYQSETQVAERRRDLIQAQYTYKSALDGLRRLIGADLTADLRKLEIVLDDDPAALPSQARILPFEEALEAALRVRPEASAARRRISVDELNARVARNSLLPRLDLVAQGIGSGLAGNQIAITGPLGVSAPAVSTGFGSSLSQLFGFTYPSYGGGIQISLPFRNSTASSQLADALVNRVRDRYTERQVQQQITLNVRQAITGLELANATIEAAKRARDLAKLNVEAEQQKYELGTITAFEVLDSQNRLANSENALLTSFVAYQEAYVNYERATWTLLDGLGMVLESPKVK